MKVILGADHGGFDYKTELVKKLQDEGYEVIDKGAFALDEADDYPQFAFAVAEQLQQEGAESDAKGILLCRSGAGMTIAANKVQGVRAVQARTKEEVIHARQHNNANILTLSADWISAADAWQLADTFLNTPFSNEARHRRRVQQISIYELERHQ